MPEESSLLPALRRGPPRALGVVVGLVMVSAPPHPNAWWRYVRTGVRMTAPPEYVEAKDRVAAAPTTVAAGLSEASAARVAAVLEGVTRGARPAAAGSRA